MAVLCVKFLRVSLVLWFLIISFASMLTRSSEVEEFCPYNNEESSCSGSSNSLKGARYVFYDVNPPEGFNLRRDVYMRMAVFVRRLTKTSDWHLVLPPWPPLYHWRSRDVGPQNRLRWSLFFDIESLQKFSPVLDMAEYLSENKDTTIDEVYILQHFKEDWEAGKWEEKFSIESCNESPSYEALDDGNFGGPFWGYDNITAKSVRCLSFHGRASQLSLLMAQTFGRRILVDHAEVVLHDAYGDREYWEARRSMRFAHPLRRLATEFRRTHLNSTDVEDRTVRPDDWTQEKPHRTAVGGPYLCVHLRRQDFLWGRPKEVPSLQGAARQVKDLLKNLELRTLFVATDAPKSEFKELQQLLAEFNVVRYEPDHSVRQAIKDGGVAIVDQIICSHARYFSGTYESTFSFRIQEEREILGFPSDTTFNRLCGDAAQGKCSPPSRWQIVF